MAKKDNGLNFIGKAIFIGIAALLGVTRIELLILILIIIVVCYGIYKLFGGKD